MQRPELITRIVDKKTVLYNIRESRLEYMFHRKHISEAQYISGSRYRRLCEISQLGSGTSNMQPRIDGYYDKNAQFVKYETSNVLEKETH